MAKWVRIRLTESQYEELVQYAKSTRRTMTDAAVLAMIGQGCITDDIVKAFVPKSNGGVKKEERHETYAEYLARIKGEAERDGFKVNEDGRPIDSEGRLIRKSADGDWDFVEEEGA